MARKKRNRRVNQRSKAVLGVAICGVFFYSCQPLSTCGKCKDLFKDEHSVLYLWIKPTYDLPKEDVLRGCQMWEEVGVRCVEVRNPDIAHVKIFAQKSPGCRNEFGRFRWAYAEPEGNGKGKIYILPRCIEDYLWKKNEIRRYWDYIRAAAAHEIGHILGIKHLNEPTALMNGIVFFYTQCLTQADIEAYKQCRNQYSLKDSRKADHALDSVRNLASNGIDQHSICLNPHP